MISPRFRTHALPEELERPWNSLEWVSLKASLHIIHPLGLEDNNTKFICKFK
jgi:hypothetical protein